MGWMLLLSNSIVDASCLPVIYIVLRIILEKVCFCCTSFGLVGRIFIG